MENFAFLEMKFHPPVLPPFKYKSSSKALSPSIFLFMIQSSANTLAVDSGGMYSGKSR